MRNSMPKVSIIIPVYNVEEYLRQCLDSVVNQTLKDIEIICVDDCSTDGSYEILQEYASKDDRFVVLKQEINQGQGVARNRGLDIAKGEYIMFLDPDDWYELDACESAYNQIIKNNNDLVFFNLTYFYEKSKTYKIDIQKLNKFEKDINNPQIKFSKLDYPFFGNGESVYKIYKREFINANNIRFPNYRFCEDLVFYAKVITCAKSASILDKSLYYYRIHENNTIKQGLYKDLLAAQKDAFKIICNCEYSDKYSKLYAVAYIQSLLYWFNKYTKQNPEIEEDFYNNIRKVFISLDKYYLDENTKRLLPQKILKKFNKIVSHDYETYKKSQFIERVFSFKNIFKNTTHNLKREEHAC